MKKYDWVFNIEIDKAYVPQLMGQKTVEIPGGELIAEDMTTEEPIIPKFSVVARYAVKKFGSLQNIFSIDSIKLGTYSNYPLGYFKENTASKGGKGGNTISLEVAEE